MPGDVLLPDDEMDPELRDYLARFLTPRTGLDGRQYWPIDEVSLEALATEPHPDPLVAHLLELADSIEDIASVEPDDQSAGDLR
jgi:hypothetical protein